VGGLTLTSVLHSINLKGIEKEVGETISARAYVTGYTFPIAFSKNGTLLQNREELCFFIRCRCQSQWEWTRSSGGTEALCYEPEGPGFEA
jgi:hypothetical protein